MVVHVRQQPALARRRALTISAGATLVACAGGCLSLFWRIGR